MASQSECKIIDRYDRSSYSLPPMVLVAILHREEALVDMYHEQRQATFYQAAAKFDAHHGPLIEIIEAELKSDCSRHR